METTLMENALEVLAGLGVDLHLKRGRRPAGLATGEEIWVLGGGQATKEVLATPHGQRRGPEKKRDDQELPRLWVADYLRPAAAEEMIRRGRAFVDGAGNTDLRPLGMLVHVMGRRPNKLPRNTHHVKVTREWRTPAIRVLFHLLCDPPLVQKPILEIAAAADVAAGTVVYLMQDLEQAGTLLRLGGHKRRLVPDEDLVYRWIAEYTGKLRPRTLLGRFETSAPQQLQECDLAAHNAVWGGEEAAKLLGANLRPGTWTIYVKGDPVGILQAARLRPNPQGAIEIREAFWTRPIDGPRTDIVHPLLLVADLLAIRDHRCGDAARFIKEEFLAGLIG